MYLKKNIRSKDANILNTRQFPMMFSLFYEKYLRTMFCQRVFTIFY